MGRFCLFSSIFQLPFYTLVFSEWGCFFLLVRLGSGGNTKDFLSLSKKAPPQLSGLLACRYGRRRGLRNSLHSNSPRPFPSVFLASSPPDKGGIGDCCFCLYSNPLALWALPLYSLTETQGERLRFDFVAIAVFHPLCFINPSVLRTPPLYFAAQNTGEEF